MVNSNNARKPLVTNRGGNAPTHVMDHLLGIHRGTRQVLWGEFILVGTSTDAQIHFPSDREPSVAPHHVTLERKATSYLLKVEPDGKVLVNGESVEIRMLVDGDIIQIGEGGPVLRFRSYKKERTSYKSISEVFEDCADRARFGAPTSLRRAAIFLNAMPRDLMTQTSPWSRGVIVSLLVLLFAATAVLMVRTWRIEQQLESQSTQIHGIAGLLEQTDQYSLSPEYSISPEGLREVRSELESRLSDAIQRVEALEARSRAGQRVIEAAARSVVFLQGEYGFLDPGAGALLRIVLDQDGRPVQDAEGNPSVSSRGAGPIVGRLFMGTAFIATDDGLLLTNRHVALPWEFDESAKAISQLGLIPTMHRLIGYLPGIEESFDVELVLASETADIAVLRSEIPKGQVLPIELSTSPPQPGEEVFVLGYPTGIRALLARTKKAFVDSLLRDEQSDFWFLARRLSEGGVHHSAGDPGHRRPSDTGFDSLRR